MINRRGLLINVFFSSFTYHFQDSFDYQFIGFIKLFYNKLETRAGAVANSREILYLLSACRTCSA